MATRRFLVTAGLPYSNGRLHVGHVAGAYLPADTYVRYLRARGEDVRFVCGSDDNGVASLISARKEGKRVEELTAHYNARQREDFRGLGIDFDIYGGTHQPEFVERATSGSARSSSAGSTSTAISSRRTSEQLYDPVARQFLPDRYVRGTCYHVRTDGTPCRYREAYGDQCESCGNAIDPLRLDRPGQHDHRDTPGAARRRPTGTCGCRQFERAAARSGSSSKRAPGRRRAGVARVDPQLLAGPDQAGPARARDDARSRLGRARAARRPRCHGQGALRLVRRADRLRLVHGRAVRARAGRRRGVTSAGGRTRTAGSCTSSARTTRCSTP